MKNTFLTLSFLASALIFGQEHTDDTEKLLDDMCVEFTQTAHLSEGERFLNIANKYIIPYSSTFTEEEWAEESERLFLRFQRKCDSFKNSLAKIHPNTNDNYELLSEKTTANISKKDLAAFKKQQHFYYFDSATNEKVSVEITKNHWTEHFADGTHSKTHFRWISNNQFELEFIESDNFIRNRLNKKGDKYNYEILSKENDFYWILTEVEGQTFLFKYKLFVGK